MCDRLSYARLRTSNVELEIRANASRREVPRCVGLWGVRQLGAWKRVSYDRVVVAKVMQLD